MQRLGLDLGSSSIGWALRDDEKITNWGVITFHSGMSKGATGGYESPTRERRTARSKRRLLQSRKYRKWALLKVLIENKHVPLEISEFNAWSKYSKGRKQVFPENPLFLKWLACDFTYLEKGIKYDNPYQIRVKAIEQKLTPHEFGRALYHLVQRRGYKDIGETDKETEKQKERRETDGFEKALKTNRTIAEALTIDFLNNGKRARNQYPFRDEYENELKLICEGQGFDVSKGEKGNYTDAFVSSLRKAIIWQRPLRTQKGNIGKCTLEPTKQRCPISHPIYEIFRALSFINTIKYYNEQREKQSLSAELRNLLFSFFLKKDANFKFEEVRKYLDKQFGAKKEYNYPLDKEGIYDTSVSGMPICKGLIDIWGDAISNNLDTIHQYNITTCPKVVNGYSVWDLWHVLFDFDKQHLETFAIQKLKLENKVNKRGEKYSPFVKLKNSVEQGYSDLSLKAMCKIIPFLKDGYLYSEAVALAKLPELLGSNWESQKEKVVGSLSEANQLYSWNKLIAAITNKLIDLYKGLEGYEKFAERNFDYVLDKDDFTDIEKTCIGYFGEKTWLSKINKKEILDAVGEQYQSFFNDTKRAYRDVPQLTNLFKNKLAEANIELAEEPYHHSNRKNMYGATIFDKKTGLEILPEPTIDSIKNPMFNKAMTILRKLVNELVLNGTIDTDTEIVIELARELNDNNKRAAIERYQNERKNNREKYRQFLNEFNEKEHRNINVEESLPVFEMWTEQTFEKTEDEKKSLQTNQANSDILKEKEAIKRYELWMEQKGQCMYTGKMISIAQLFSKEIDIEHTIPRSILPDNTMANQTVCYAWYNREVKKTDKPFDCPNYNEDKPLLGRETTSIAPRLENWIQKRDGFKKQYEDRLRPRGNEDEAKKNTRIQEKHYFKMHYDYWTDKVSRFEADEVKDSWARRQLVDTQMTSKYAREFLRTYFKKVAVQKGSVTADFRKIYSFQEQDEIKSRNKHTHHAIDAAVLTLIPVNSSHRDKVLKTMYELYEREHKQYTTKPFAGFNSQQLIRDIDNNTLIVNYETDKILKQTYRNVRKRGKLQFVKDKNGKFVLDKDGNKIQMKANGDTVRSPLFKDTFVAKIKDVERYEDGQPIREGDDWKYKKGKDEFLFVKREDIEKVRSKIDDIVDPVIKELVRKQKNEPVIKDYQGNIIRHVRIKTSAGQVVKERSNFLSKHFHKNNYYAAAGSVPYAIMLHKVTNDKVERAMIPLASFDFAQIKRQAGKFDIDLYIKEKYPQYGSYKKQLLKVGQKVIVLKNDKEFEKSKKIDFQVNRLYVITQFSEGSVWLKCHSEAQSKDEIKDSTKFTKDKILRAYEIPIGIAEIVEDNSIQNRKQRIEDFENRKFRFDTLNSHRFKLLAEKLGLEETKRIKKELDRYKAIASSIELEGNTPLLKTSKEGWNFLYENYDFKVSLLGKLTFGIHD